MKINREDLGDIGALYMESVQGKNIDDILLEKEGEDEKAKKIELKLKKKPETGEWVVRYIEDGKVNDDKSYYTDDKEDAESTMEKMKEELVSEGLMDRIGSRVGSGYDSMKDTASNIKKAGQNAMSTMRGEKPKEKGKNIKYEYEKRKTKRILDSHMNKLQTQLSDFATDLVKLGLAPERDAEQIAKQAFSAIERTKKLKSLKNLYEA